MDSLRGRFSALLSWLLWILGAIVVAVIAHRWPFLADVQGAIDRHKAMKVGVVVATGLSGLAFLGAGLYAMATGPSVAGGFQVNLSMREIKEAARAGRWQTDPRWRLHFLMMTAGSLMGIGLLATIFVLGDVFAKLLMTLMFVYAAARTVWAFSRA